MTFLEYRNVLWSNISQKLLDRKNILCQRLLNQPQFDNFKINVAIRRRIKKVKDEITLTHMSILNTPQQVCLF